MSGLFQRRNDRRASALTELEVKKCTGNCFGLAELLARIPESVDTPIVSTQSSSIPSNEQLYHQLTKDQTRIIRLQPKNASNPLSIELLTADVTNSQGLKLANTQHFVKFVALSYCWDKSAQRSVICNGFKIWIYSNVFDALCYHQKEEPVYIWIDAVCINQQDNAEKAEQVAMMFDIYTKASYVTAWLGEADRNSMIAYACLEHSSDFTKEQYDHDARCAGNMKQVYESLLCFYERPYLARTWIRQEVYAARAVSVVCGEKIDWKTYLNGSELLQCLQSQLHYDISARHQRVQSFITDAKTSLNTWNSAHPIPRELLTVLISSSSYGAKDDRDRIYAILKMCGVVPVTNAEWKADGLSILISYDREETQCYRDISLHLLLSTSGQMKLRRLWQYMVGTHDNIPSWVTNMKSGRCNDSDVNAIQYVKRYMRFQATDPNTRMLNRWNLQEMESDSVNVDGMSYRLAAETITSPSVELSPNDDAILHVRGKVVNYVAHVTRYTCDLEKFVTTNLYPGLGRAGRTIHLRRKPKAGHALFGFQPETVFDEFNPNLHDRKIAILGTHAQFQLALVPASTMKGDIVVVVAADTLPLVLSPLSSDYTRSLFPAVDPYDDCLEYEKLSWAEINHDKYTALRFIGICWMIVIVSLIITFSLLSRNNPPKSVQILQILFGVIAAVSGISSMVFLFGAMAESPMVGPGWLHPLVAKLKDKLAVLDRLTVNFDAQYRIQGSLICRRDLRRQVPVMIRKHDSVAGVEFAEARSKWWPRYWEDAPLQTFEIH